MTDLRRAVEMALEALESVYGKGKRCETAMKELRQALAESANSTTDFVEPKASSQPEQEPVCFLRETAWSYEIAPWGDPNGFPVYTAPPKQEYQYEVVAEHADGTYTTRRIQKREWVGLTDDEVIKCFDSVAFGQVEDDLIINKHVNIFRAIHAIEAKLKEKNT